MQLHRRSTLLDWKNISTLFNPFNHSQSQSNQSHLSLNTKLDDTNSDITCTTISLLSPETSKKQSNGNHQPALSHEDIFQILQDQDKYDLQDEGLTPEIELYDETSQKMTLLSPNISNWKSATGLAVTLTDDSKSHNILLTPDSNNDDDIHEKTTNLRMRITVAVTTVCSESSGSSSSDDSSSEDESVEFSLDSSEWSNIIDEMDEGGIDEQEDNGDTSPYISQNYTDIHEITTFENEDESDLDIINYDCMDWRDDDSVRKIKELLSNLLLVASTNNGIREDELFLMFSTPTPESIIQQLRFGVLAGLCIVKLDRFGRRSYLYCKDHKHKKHGSMHMKVTETHVFTRLSRLPSQLGLKVSELQLFMADSVTSNSIMNYRK